MHFSSVIIFTLAAAANASLNPHAGRSIEYRYFSANKQEVKRSNFTQPIMVGGVPISTHSLNEIAAFEGETHALSEGHHFFQPNWFLTTQDGIPQWMFNSSLRNAMDELGTSRVHQRSVEKRGFGEMFITGQCSADAECAQSAVCTIGVGICSGAAAAQESFSYDIIAEGATSAVVDILEDGVVELGLALLEDDVIGLIWTTLQWAWF